MVGSGAGWGAPRPAPPPPPSVAYDDERSREERELAAALRAINGAWERRWASQNAEQLGAPKADDGRRIARWLVANRAGYGTTLEVLAERIVAGFFDAKLALRKPQRRPRSEWLAEDPGRYATRPAEADHAAHKRATARATSDRDAEIEARYRRAELEAEAPPSMVGELLSGLRLGRTGS